MKNFAKSSRGRIQGHPKIFRAPIYRAQRAVIFAIAQLSCLEHHSAIRLRRSIHEYIQLQPKSLFSFPHQSIVSARVSCSNNAGTR